MFCLLSEKESALAAFFQSRFFQKCLGVQESKQEVTYIYGGQTANSITKTCLYNIDPLKPHFYIVKLGFTWVYIIFLISTQKHRLWVLIRTASMRRL